MSGVSDWAVSFTAWIGLGTVNCRSVYKVNKKAHIHLKVLATLRIPGTTQAWNSGLDNYNCLVFLSLRRTEAYSPGPTHLSSVPHFSSSPPGGVLEGEGCWIPFELQHNQCRSQETCSVGSPHSANGFHRGAPVYTGHTAKYKSPFTTRGTTMCIHSWFIPWCMILGVVGHEIQIFINPCHPYCNRKQ